MIVFLGYIRPFTLATAPGTAIPVGVRGFESHPPHILLVSKRRSPRLLHRMKFRDEI